MAIGETIGLIEALGNGGGGSSGGGVLVVHDVDGTLDKTWNEIHDAMLGGGVVIEEDGSILATVEVGAGKSYYVITYTKEYYTTSASGYPSYTE